MDRSLRSVFVGNIPYEATEEQLRDIFSEVGSVVGFRLVYDRDSGRSKGYGFCEYQDQEAAASAMRSLHGREVGGRALRVDSANSERGREELRGLGPAAPVVHSPYGAPVHPEDAPASITRAMACVPPELLLELLTQVQLWVRNDHQEARSKLLQNPQLAYALLQVQVLMRNLDPDVALTILHPEGHGARLAPGSSQAGSETQTEPGPGPGPSPGLDKSPTVLPNQLDPPAPQLLARRSAREVPPLLQTPSQGRNPGPVPAAAQLGPGPGSLMLGWALQPHVGVPRVGLVPLGQSQLQMADLRAPRPRGPVTAGGPPQRGLLGDAPNDPRGGTLLSVTREAESRGYPGPLRQGPARHRAHARENRGPSASEMRGVRLADPRLLVRDPRGPAADQRGMPKDGRAGRDSRAMEAEPREMERRGKETCATETRGTEVRGVEIRGLGPSSRGPMTGGIQGPRPISMGKGGLQGPRQVPSVSGVGNPGAGKQGAALHGAGVQGAGMQGGGVQGAGMQRGVQGAGVQGAGVQGGVQGAGVQGAGGQGAGVQKADVQVQRAGVQGAGVQVQVQRAGVQGASVQGGGVQGAGVQRGVLQGAGLQGEGKQNGGLPSSFSSRQNRVTPQDQEKAALILQILLLTADQIALLPPEQRKSIRILKEHILKFTGDS